VEQFFAERIKSVSGGERALNSALEKIRLCESRRAVQRPELEKFLRAY
jgi:hypothetical protein